MVMKGCHFEAVVQGDTHYRIDLVFEQSSVTHDHRLGTGLHKGCICRKPHGWRHLYSRDGDFEIAARNGNFKHALFLAEFSFYARELLDFGGVEFPLRCETG